MFPARRPLALESICNNNGSLFELFLSYEIHKRLSPCQIKFIIQLTTLIRLVKLYEKTMRYRVRITKWKKHLIPPTLPRRPCFLPQSTPGKCSSTTRDVPPTPSKPSSPMSACSINSPHPIRPSAQSRQMI